MNMEDIQVRWRRDNTNNQKKIKNTKLKINITFFLETCIYIQYPHHTVG